MLLTLLVISFYLSLVFLGPALDMTFKIYDASFRLLETIHHDERVILDCEYDDARDILIMSGAAG